MLGKLIFLTGLVCLSAAAQEPISGQKKQLRLFHKGKDAVNVQSSLSSTDCVPNSKKANPLNRQTYFQCTGDGLALMKCPEKMVFEAASSACIKEVIPSANEKAPTCTYDGEFIPSTTDCQQYYLCNGGIPYLFECSSVLLWDQSLLTCNWPWAVTCGAVGWSPAKNVNSLETVEANKEGKNKRKWGEQ